MPVCLCYDFRTESRFHMTAQSLELDPLILLLDARLPSERVRCEVVNDVYPVVYAPRTELRQNLERIARLVGSRHVIVIDTDQTRAEADAAILRSAEVWAVALGGREAGWLQSRLGSSEIR